MKVYTFPRGGISYKEPAAPPGNSSAIAFLPIISVIPLIQHSGGKTAPVVNEGEQVSEGMLIGRAHGRGTANIHATTPGLLKRYVSWTMADGRQNEAAVIQLEGSFEKLGKRVETFSWHNQSPQELSRSIAHFGIVDMEGDGTPVSELIAAQRRQESPFTLVVRCVFDDPWLAADYVLTRERLADIAEGAAITAKAAGAGGVLLAVSAGDEGISEGFMEAINPFDVPFRTVVVGNRYPQHNQRELEIVLRQYEKKEEQDLGDLLILGPATMAAVFDAVRLRKPILERYVAVGGGAVKKPQVLRVRIGMRFKELFENCGGFSGTPACIATGSPLLGQEVLSMDEPVIKTTSSVFALLPKQTGGKAAANCIGCGECRVVCPVGLDPEFLYKGVWSGAPAELRNQCHGCGCCDVVCPSRLPLSISIRLDKGEDKA